MPCSVNFLTGPRRLGETQVCLITLCMSMCICQGTHGDITHSNCIICGKCSKRTIYKSVDKMKDNHKIYCNALGLIPPDAFIICSPKERRAGALLEMEMEWMLWGEGCLSGVPTFGHRMQSAPSKVTEK